MTEVCKRSVTIQGHRTSFSLEQPFFDQLTEIAATRGVALARLVAEVDAERPRASNLSSALRVYVLLAIKSGRPDPTASTGEG